MVARNFMNQIQKTFIYVLVVAIQARKLQTLAFSTYVNIVNLSGGLVSLSEK